MHLLLTHTAKSWTQATLEEAFKKGKAFRLGFERKWGEAPARGDISWVLSKLGVPFNDQACCEHVYLA